MGLISTIFVCVYNDKPKNPVESKRFGFREFLEGDLFLGVGVIT